MILARQLGVEPVIVRRRALEIDLDTPIWAGVLPLESRFTTLRGDDHVAEGIVPSDAVRAMEGTKL